MKTQTGLKLVGYEQRRQIDAIRDATGQIIELRPIANSEHSFIDLELPNGTVVRAELANDDFDKLIVPLFVDDQPLESQSEGMTR